MRSRRRRDLVRILHEGRATSQEEIVRALRRAGHEVTQATVSRDLHELGAAKVRVGDAHVYVLRDAGSPPAEPAERALARALEEFAVEVAAAGNLAVVKTVPGHAAAVARAIDLAGSKEVVGTVAGDDTVFVATPDAAAARRLAAAWGAHMTGGGR